MRDGNFMKEKMEYLKEKFQTKQGWADFLIGTAIWGFLIMEYRDAVFNYFMQLSSPLGNELLQAYIGFLGLGITFTVVGIVVSAVIVTGYRWLSNE